MREAAARRQAADEAKKAAMLAKQAAKQHRSSASLAPPETGADPMQQAAADAAQAPDGLSPPRGSNPLLEPTEKEKRAAQAAQRRQALEEAKKAELLQKRQAKAERREAPDADHEVGRIEAMLADLPAGRAGDASRAGLKKQLMAAKAVAVREQRKREMAEREAKKAAAVQQSRPPSAPAEVVAPQGEAHEYQGE